MSKIERYEVNEQWAHSGIVKAGDYCFLSYCVGNIGGTIEEQINGAFDNMEERLAMGRVDAGECGSDGLPVQGCVEYSCNGKSHQGKVQREVSCPEIHSDEFRTCWRSGWAAIPG